MRPQDKRPDPGGRGEIYFLNHESWFGFLEHLESPNDDERSELEEEVEEVLEQLGLSSAAGLTTDQFVDLVSHDQLDGMAFLASDLATFWKQLQATRC